MTTQERTQFKALLSEIISENAPLFQELLAEVLEEKLASEEREARIRQLIQADFKKYKKVFEALA